MVLGRKGNDDTGVCPTAYQAARPPRHEPQGDITKARRIAHDRGQVRQPRDYSPKPSNTARPGRSLVDDGYAAIVDGWPAADLRMPVKQRHTAARVYERLVAECGFTGSYSSVQRWVKRWRQERRSGTTLILIALYRSSCTLVYSPLKYRGGRLWREECPKAVVLKRI